MSNEQVRTEFEAWALTHFINSETMRPLIRDNDEPDEYRYSRVNMAWISWQASREVIVIELPCETTECVDGEFIYLDLASEAIESKGLKWVKQ